MKSLTPHLLAVAFFLSGCASQLPHSETSDVFPDAFSAYVGGRFGNSYQVKAERDHLVYTQFDGFDVKKVKRIRPTHESWCAFWNEMDSVSIWKWKRDGYLPREHIDDGTQWGISISKGKKQIQTGGDNGYPADDDPQNTHDPKEIDSSNRFKDFCKAVQKLIGGRPFAFNKNSNKHIGLTSRWT